MLNFYPVNWFNEWLCLKSDGDFKPANENRIYFDD